MAIRSLQVAAYRTVGTTPELLYTVPAGKTLIIKSIDMSWRTSIVPGTLRLTVNPVGAVPATGITYKQFTFQLEDYHLLTWLVLEPGDELLITASHVSAGFVIVSGALLEGIA